MRATNKFLQVFGLVCPFTGKIRFVEIAKNANLAYESLLRAAPIFSDSISDWINILKNKGVKPGLVLLDTKTTDGPGSKNYWEKVYGIVKEEPLSTSSNKNTNRSTNRKSKSQSIHMEKIADEEAKLARDNSSAQNTDPE